MDFLFDHIGVITSHWQATNYENFVAVGHCPTATKGIYEGGSPMPETLGTLNLKIARLEQHLAVLKQQQRLSSPYPDHKAQLSQEYFRQEVRLRQLTRRRQEFLQTPLAA